jgi:hypothetical protein
MSAYADAQTTGGYGDTSDSGGSSTGQTGNGTTTGGSWWQNLAAGAVNRYMDVETWKQTQGQMPPNYYSPNGGGKVQAINTGTQMSYNTTVAGVPVWALAVGAVALFLVLRK